MDSSHKLTRPSLLYLLLPTKRHCLKDKVAKKMHRFIDSQKDHKHRVYSTECFMYILMCGCAYACGHPHTSKVRTVRSVVHTPKSGVRLFTTASSHSKNIFQFSLKVKHSGPCFGSYMLGNIRSLIKSSKKLTVIQGCLGY